MNTTKNTDYAAIVRESSGESCRAHLAVAAQRIAELEGALAEFVRLGDRARCPTYLRESHDAAVGGALSSARALLGGGK